MTGGHNRSRTDAMSVETQEERNRSFPGSSKLFNTETIGFDLHATTPPSDEPRPGTGVHSVQRDSGMCPSGQAEYGTYNDRPSILSEDKSDTEGYAKASYRKMEKAIKRDGKNIQSLAGLSLSALLRSVRVTPKHPAQKKRNPIPGCSP